MLCVEFTSYIIYFTESHSLNFSILLFKRKIRLSIIKDSIDVFDTQQNHFSISPISACCSLKLTVLPAA